MWGRGSFPRESIFNKVNFIALKLFPFRVQQPSCITVVQECLRAPQGFRLFEEKLCGEPSSEGQGRLFSVRCKSERGDSVSFPDKKSVLKTWLLELEKCHSKYIFLIISLYLEIKTLWFLWNLILCADLSDLC